MQHFLQKNKRLDYRTGKGPKLRGSGSSPGGDGLRFAGPILPDLRHQTRRPRQRPGQTGRILSAFDFIGSTSP